MNTVIVDLNLILYSMPDAVYKVCKSQLKKAGKQKPKYLYELCHQESYNSILNWYKLYTGTVESVDSIKSDWWMLSRKRKYEYTQPEKVLKKFMEECNRCTSDVVLFGDNELFDLEHVKKRYGFTKVIVKPCTDDRYDIIKALSSYDHTACMVTGDFCTAIAAKEHGLAVVYCGRYSEALKGIADRRFKKLSEVRVPKLISGSLCKERTVKEPDNKTT